jgi:hypothetical protein
MSMTQTVDETLVNRVAQQYEEAGYTVSRHPKPEQLPFDLGFYQPDLLARRADNGGVIVAIKDREAGVSVDRLRSIAELVAEHEGWRFLLVTETEDTAVGNLITPLPSWAQIRQRYERGLALQQNGQPEEAFITLWLTLEALLRKQAEEAAIPITQFAAIPLIKHLYSQGELSIPHFDTLMSLAQLRNKVFHGFSVATPELAQANQTLQTVMSELLAEWQPQPS